MNRQKPQGNTRYYVQFSVVLLCTLWAYVNSSAQTVNGSLHGTVLDESGAVVPQAHIVVTSLSHGGVREAITDNHGFYTVTGLPPADYSISVSKSGFEGIMQPMVQLLVNQDLEANYTLRIGKVTETVEVNSAMMMLDTTGATLEQVIGAKLIDDLPLNGRQFTQLILLSPGAAPKETGQQTGQIISVGAGGISPSTNGQQGTQNNFFLDGIWNNQFFTQGWNISPPPDAIQEFSAQNHMTDARFGLSSGSNINLVTKSGGPAFHGDGWEFVRNDTFDAAGFFANLTHSPNPPYRQNQFGGTIGGPVIFPFYNGREKHTYFFGYYEGFRSAQTSTAFGNVPTSNEEGGDFTDLLTNSPVTDSNGQSVTDALGRPMFQGVIYNPVTTRQVTAGQQDSATGLVAQSSGLVRDPFQGNVVPTSMIPKVAAIYLNTFYPTPNYGPGGNSFPNYVGPVANRVDANEFGIGIDHTFGNNDVLSGRFYYGQVGQLEPSFMKAGLYHNHNDGRTGSISYLHAFSRTFQISGKYGYIWSWFGQPTDPAGLQLLNEMNAEQVAPVQDGLAEVPGISLGARFNGTSQSGNALGPNETSQANVDVEKIVGPHTFGVGVLFMKTHSYDNGWGTGYYFDQFPTSGIDSTGQNQPLTGDGLATMLTDTISQLSLSYGNTAADIKSHFLGVYAQDKWQATAKLNVTFGLRWDYMSPPHYLRNQFSMWDTGCPIPSNRSFDQQQINQIELQCYLMPVPYVIQPTSQFPNPVSWTTPNAPQTVWQPQYNGWEPRLGIAYAETKKIVLRAGFGIFDDHNYFQQLSQDSRGSWPWGGGVGFPNLDRGIPNEFWTNLPPSSNYLNNPNILIGTAGNPRAKIPYTMEYNFGIAYQMISNLALNIDYVGSQGRHQFGSFGYNAPLPSLMGPNAVPNGEPFPFLGNTIQGDDTSFSNNYNSLQAKLELRASRSLSFLASYTYSKCLDEVEGMWESWPEDTYDTRLDYGPCDYDFPHVFTFSGVYDLPFGHGAAFGKSVNGIRNAFIGGWHLSDVTSARSGNPFSVYVPFDSANTGVGQRANLVPGCNVMPHGFHQSYQAWLDPACFTTPPLYTFGNSGKNSLRAQGLFQSDMALFKFFSLSEAKRLELRAEAFNIFNKTEFSTPGGLSVGAPGFMQIYSTAPARELQFAVKVYF